MSDADKQMGTGWPTPSFISLNTWFPWLNSPRPEGEAGETPPLEAQFNDMRDTWMASLSKWTQFANEAARGETPDAEQLRGIFAPAAWMESAGGAGGVGLQQMLEGPRYATLWDLDRKLAELQQSTLQRNKDVAVFRSEEFLEAQRRMLRSSSDQRLQERKISEAWCEAAQLPTRGEVDELQRLVIELRREVRTLRRGATAPEAEKAPRGETRAPARRRKASARSRT